MVRWAVIPGVALFFRSRHMTMSFHAGNFENINETNRSTSGFSVVRENSSLNIEIICWLFGFLRCSKIMRCGFRRSSFGFGVNDRTEVKRSENKCQSDAIHSDDPHVTVILGRIVWHPVRDQVREHIGLPPKKLYRATAPAARWMDCVITADFGSSE